MKKILALTLSLLTLVACSSTPAKKEEAKEMTTDAQETSTLKVGMGSLRGIKGTDVTEDKDASVRATTVIVSLATKDDKIVYINIDEAQNSATFDKEGKITSDKDKETMTKTELKDAYGMKAASTIGKEWYEQKAAFEEYALGKTVEEVLATKVMERDEHHKSVPDVEELKTSVTIDIEDFLKGIEKASANSVEVKDVAKLGTSSITSLKLSDAGEKDGKVQFNTYYNLVAKSADDKIVYTSLDVAQNSVAFDATGKITSDLSKETMTKAELKDAYGMKAASTIGKEWYEQKAAFEEYALGKTVEEVLATKVMERDEHHKSVPDVEELKTSVTIDIGTFLKVIEKSNSNLVEVK